MIILVIIINSGVCCCISTIYWRGISRTERVAWLWIVGKYS
jgi:hypothetical protein